MKCCSDRRYVTNLALIPVLAISVLLLAVPSLDAQEIVDPRSGQLVLAVTDLTVQAGPVTLEIRRSLESMKRQPGLLGTRWRLNWESGLVPCGPLMLVEKAPREVAFSPAGDKPGYVAASGHLKPDGSGCHCLSQPCSL